MSLKPGRAYVYVAYGVHRMLNVSSEGEGVGAAVLIRAVELLEGRRADGKPHPDHRIASGPGLVARAFNIDLSLNGADMTTPGPLWIARDYGAVATVVSSPRIGISKNKDVLWRFHDAQSPCISRHR
jgi:DNA-3-methyladenine glycosylase